MSGVFGWHIQTSGTCSALLNFVKIITLQNKAVKIPLTEDVNCIFQFGLMSVLNNRFSYILVKDILVIAVIRYNRIDMS